MADERVYHTQTEVKQTWGPGPWQAEPDKLFWRDAATGLPCLIVRGPMGNLCGYVGIYPGHPLHATGYAQCPLNCETAAVERRRKAALRAAGTDGLGARIPAEIWERTREWVACDHTPEHLLRAHGGITFADFCADHREPGEPPLTGEQQAQIERTGICHPPAPGEPGPVWWFGFDCGHCYDYSPRHRADMRALRSNLPHLFEGGLDRAALEASAGFPRETYKDVAYVREEVGELAAQLKAIGDAGTLPVYDEVLAGVEEAEDLTLGERLQLALARVENPPVRELRDVWAL